MSSVGLEKSINQSRKASEEIKLGHAFREVEMSFEQEEQEFDFSCMFEHSQCLYQHRRGES